MQNRKQSIIDLLRHEHFKITSARLRIIDKLLETKKHTTVEELYREVNKELPTVGLATVYRTVNILYRFHVLSKLDLADGFDRYELSDTLHQHHHLICDGCGKIWEVHEDFLESLEKQVRKIYQFHVSDHEVILHGYCDTCYHTLNGEKNE